MVPTPSEELAVSTVPALAELASTALKRSSKPKKPMRR
jgi:hypothetical protein